MASVKRVLLPLAVLLLSGCLQEPSSGAGSCAGPFPEKSASPYALPYRPGEAYVVGQGNCTQESHSEDQEFAYDFDMPLGTIVVAARSGVVLDLVERFADGTRVPGEENYVLVEHADGTVGGYYHLTTEGASVEAGDRVEQGQPIARSGDSGDSTEPHLHFEVLECRDCRTLPVNFRNTRAHDRGLAEGESYEALPAT